MVLPGDQMSLCSAQVAYSYDTYPTFDKTPVVIATNGRGHYCATKIASVKEMNGVLLREAGKLVKQSMVNVLPLLFRHRFVVVSSSFRRRFVVVSHCCLVTVSLCCLGRCCASAQSQESLAMMRKELSIGYGPVWRTCLRAHDWLWLKIWQSIATSQDWASGLSFQPTVCSQDCDQRPTWCAFFDSLT